MYPSYLEAYNSGKLDKVTALAFSMLESCSICPRQCKVNRLKDQPGFCQTGLKAKVYNFLSHHGEEPPISGTNGSGTIFFAHCNMACVYCQNYEFSQSDKSSRSVDAKELAAIMLELQAAGCHNINFVSPTHLLPQILAGLKEAIKLGLKIPLVYNTGGYESVEMIKLLEGIIDIYLPDMRYADSATALKYSSARDYPRHNQEALKEMQRQAGVADIAKNGIIKRGLIIRHLVLPRDISGSEKIMKFIAEELSRDTYISLMSQYFPHYKACAFPELNRRISREEYRAAQKAMRKYGLSNGWIQESRGLDSYAGINIKPRKKKNAPPQSW